jgi:DNA-binding transcriptional ArsR family regulator
MHRRGGTRQPTVARTRAQLPDLHLTTALYNKDGRIPHYKVETPLLRRYLIKYKAY